MIKGPNLTVSGSTNHNVSDHHHDPDGAAEDPAAGCRQGHRHTQGCWPGT